MDTNEIALQLIPSRVLSEHHPGHVSVAYAEPGGDLNFRGFRFDLLDLPEEYRPAHRWRDYLFTHTVPGYVFDDISQKRSYLQSPQEVRCGQWAVVHQQPLEELRRLRVPHPQGWYSFNPDDFTDCNNCVTWACAIVQAIAGEAAVQRPRQGRIKEFALQLADSEPECR